MSNNKKVSESGLIQCAALALVEKHAHELRLAECKRALAGPAQVSDLHFPDSRDLVDAKDRGPAGYLSGINDGQDLFSHRERIAQIAAQHKAYVCRHFRVHSDQGLKPSAFFCLLDIAKAEPKTAAISTPGGLV